MNPGASSAAFQLPDRFLVHGEGRTRAGLRLAREPYLILPLTATGHELGSAILSALAAFHPIVPEPTDLKALTKPMLKAAGVTSLRRLQRASLHCSIACLPDGIQISPSHAETRGHFYTEHHLDLPLHASAELLGSTLRQAFTACTSDFPVERPN